MTVASSFTDKVYQINGTATSFSWGQDVDTQYGSLVVTEETASTNGEVVTTYTEGTDYEIVNKNVVFYTAPSDTTHYIHITRSTYRGQPVEFIEGENFPAEDYEDSLDRILMIEQEQDKAISDEETARIAADTDLQNQITAEVSRAKGVEGTLSNLTTTAKSNLVSAINEVDADVATINATLATYGDIVTHDVEEFATAAQGAKADTALQPADLGNAELDIQENGSSLGKFTANSKSDKTINITVPTTASDVGALPNSTKYGKSLSVSLNETTYVLTMLLKDQDGTTLSTQTVDLPLESVIVSGTYDSGTQSIVLTLDSGDTITIPVGDLVSGLQTEITSSNKLSADLVDDTSTTNKFVTASDKTTWSGKQDALVSGTNIKTINNTSILGSGDITVGGSSLPTQTGNAGKFLTTDGTDASWGNALTNTATGTDSLTILGNAGHANCTMIGLNSKSTNPNSTAIGMNSWSNQGFSGGYMAGLIKHGAYGVFLGQKTDGYGNYGVAIGYQVEADGNYSIQLGAGLNGAKVTNSEANTMKVCLGGTNYTLIDSTGQIPSAMLTSTLGDIETLLAAI